MGPVPGSSLAETATRVVGTRMRIALWAWTLGLLVAGCDPGPGTDGTGSVDTDDTPAETDQETDEPVDSDTDPLETGWGTDTDGAETGGGGDDTGGGGGGRDSELAQDSSPCAFGEVQDCDGNCFPVYFIGDGTCDDGSAFQSNFDCVQFSYDGGDCFGDTDPGGGPIGPTGCEWTVHMDINTWATEIGWQIQDRQGRVLYDMPTGTYTVNYREYFHTITLPDGDYTFVQTDSASDGWHGGTFAIEDPRTGVVMATGGMASGSYREQAFSLTCEVDTSVPTGPADCGRVELVVTTANWGYEIGWQLQDDVGTILAEIPYGRYQNYSTYTYTANVADGAYNFVTLDSYGDGWSGGSYRLTDLGTGAVYSEGTLEGGRRGENWFVVDCLDTGAPPVVPPIEAECDPLIVRLVTDVDGDEVGWELRDAVTGALAAEGAPGTYESRRSYDIPIEAGTGVWRFRLIDLGNDGWEGASISLVDSSSAILGTGGDLFLSGSTYFFDVGVTCPVVEEPIDTALCTADSITDCDGVCWPQSYVGDGYCDDGGGFAPDFFCAERQWDRGDCGPPP